MYVPMYVCMHICMYLWIYVLCMHFCMYVCMFVWIRSQCHRFCMTVYFCSLAHKEHNCHILLLFWNFIMFEILRLNLKFISLKSTYNFYKTSTTHIDRTSHIDRQISSCICHYYSETHVRVQTIIEVNNNTQK